MEPTTVIVSDIHLGAVPESAERAFVEFLRWLEGRTRQLLINGDLFDFWFEYRSVVPSRHFDVLRALSDLRESGVRLMLVGGNHDAWGGPFLESAIGLELLEGPVELELGDYRAFVAHGDGLAHGDLGYKLLRRLLRSGPARFAIRTVHPDLADRIVRRISRTGDPEARDPERIRERSELLSEYAHGLLGERRDLDLVVFGHCHVPEVTEVEPGRYYVNSGDWLEHRTYTWVARDGIVQREWGADGGPEAGPGKDGA